MASVIDSYLQSESATLARHLTREFETKSIETISDVALSDTRANARPAIQDGIQRTDVFMRLRGAPTLGSRPTTRRRS